MVQGRVTYFLGHCCLGVAGHFAANFLIRAKWADDSGFGLPDFSFAPCGAWFWDAWFPTACAVGCILSPLRGLDCDPCRKRLSKHQNSSRDAGTFQQPSIRPAVTCELRTQDHFLIAPRPRTAPYQLS